MTNSSTTLPSDSVTMGLLRTSVSGYGLSPGIGEPEPMKWSEPAPLEWGTHPFTALDAEGAKRVMSYLAERFKSSE